MKAVDGDERPYGKHVGDLLQAVLGTSTVLGTSILAYRGHVSLFETDVFRLINYPMCSRMGWACMSRIPGRSRLWSTAGLGHSGQHWPKLPRMRGDLGVH
jgi:hypothetical protein